MTATRRMLAVSLYAGTFAVLAWFIVPLTIAVATFDFLRGQPWTTTRALAFFLWYLACELVGVAAGFLIWLASRTWAADDPERYIDWNYSLQNFWARMLGRGAFRIFGIRLEVHEGTYRFGDAPVIVFVRHASVADTILVALLISVPHGVRLRYVLKQELLWDPCLDIVGNRVPNVFVRRDSAYTDREVAAVAGLARGLGPRDGVLIYPEGTRFSPSKKARIVEKLRQQGRSDAAAEAESFRHVLRPRSGGPFALLDVAPQADVVLLAHTGFEGSASFDRFFNGGLVGRTVHAELRVVKSRDVPKDPQARREWMMQNWRHVDEFIEAHRGLTSPSRAAAPLDADAPVPR